MQISIPGKMVFTLKWGKDQFPPKYPQWTPQLTMCMFVFITYINSLSVVYVYFIDYVTEGTADIMKDFAEHQFPDTYIHQWDTSPWYYWDYNTDTLPC